MSNHSSENRITSLDHLRALAILLVFIFHYRIFGNPPYIQFFTEFGWTGVDLFFVLSGFLIGGQLFSSLAKNDGNPTHVLRPFWIKRFFRIIPVYLFVLLLYFTIPAFSERGHLPPLWKFLTFTQNLGLDWRTGSTFSHAWSLCIEEQFYLIMPLLVISLKKFSRLNYGLILLIALFVFGFVIRLWSWNHFLVPLASQGREDDFGALYHKWIYYPTYTRLDGLLFGLSLAALFHFRPLIWQRITRYGNWLLVASLLLLTGAYFLCRDLHTIPATVFGYPLGAFSYAVLVLAALSPNCLLYRFTSRFTAFIAAISFSLYLTHKQMIHLCHVVFAHWGLDDDNVMLFFISFLVSVLTAWILRLAIERPFLRLKDRVLKRENQSLRVV